MEENLQASYRTGNKKKQPQDEYQQYHLNPTEMDRQDRTDNSY